MKHAIVQFKSLAIALKELEQFVRQPRQLQVGKPLKKFGGLRPRELLANWLMCAVVNFAHGKDDLTFTSDPLGGDGIIYDKATERSWPTEHVTTRQDRAQPPKCLEDQIVEAIGRKQRKGGAAYAEGKVLIVFLDAAGHNEPWNPSSVTRKLPKLDFVEVWVVALQEARDGAYVYGITLLDLSSGAPPIYLARIAPNFEDWQVGQIQ